MDLKVINGNNIDILKQYPDNYFDAVVTDPPYGLGKEPNAEELMKDWIEHGYHEISGKGFMGKEWDAFVPQPIFWKEVYRVLKHGGHVLSFFGTRTYDWGVMSMRFAGFEVRDCIQWIYGSGFPKSHNISKALDKMEGAEREVIGEKKRGDVQKAKENGSGYLSDPANRNNVKQFGYGIEQITKPSTDAAKQWDGWGTALKPANEPIVLARKPLEKGLSVAENVLKWGVGGINIDATRIGSETRTTPIFSNDTKADNTTFNLNSNIQHERVETNQGRFPANVILTHHPECVCKGTKKVKAIKGGNSGTIGNNVYGKFNGEKNNDGCGFGDENGEETIENWECVEDCPIKLMDEQSGILKSGAMDSIAKGGKYNVYSKMNERRVFNPPSQGGASRFFYCAKASKSERNRGLDGFEDKQTIGGGGTYNEEAGAKYGSIKAEGKNFHPTVKPVKLMEYLVNMVTPPNGIVLDPFCGSGTTGVACKINGFQFVGLEQDPEYAKIAEARINNHKTETKPTHDNQKDQLSLF